MSLDPGLLTPFAEFCEAEGVKTSKVELHLFDDDVRGVRALEALAPGDVLLRAPLHALLSVHSAASDRTLQHGLAASRQPEPEPRCLLAAHLLCQRAVPNGKWARYIATLPPTYTTLAAFPGDVVDELQVAQACARCAQEMAQMRRDYNATLPVLRAAALPPDACSWQAWRFAAGAVATRTMHLPGDSVGCLTPFGDMFNFEPPAPPVPPSIPTDEDGCKPSDLGVAGQGSAPSMEARSKGGAGSIAGRGAFCEASQQYVITAQRHYAAGEQVYLCYGHYTSLELLALYGFLLPENPHDEALLPPTAWPEALGQHADALWLHPDGRPSWSMLARLREHFMTARERRGGAAARLHAGERVSNANEAAAFGCLRDACLKALRGFATTTRQDEELLRTLRPEPASHRTACLRLAVQFRLQHKRAIARGYKAADACIATVEASVSGASR